MSETQIRPTLKTIAGETGLAVTTVSRALNDAPDIGAATKATVRAVAKRLGYRPNRGAVRLRTGRSNVISLLMSPERELSGYTLLIHAFASELRDTGYHLIVTPTFADEDPLDQLRYLRDTSSADAVILNKVQPSDPRIAFLSDQAMPFVTHGRSDMGIGHAWYDFDNECFGALALEAMFARGRRNIRVLAPPMEQNYARHMMKGAEAVAEAAGIACARLDGATSDSPAEEIGAAVAKAIAEDAPDGFLCASVASTIAAVTAVEEAGQVVGDQVDLCSKEPFPFLRRFRRDLLVVPENEDAAGAFLARAALAAIRRPDDPPMTHLEVPGHVIGI